MTLLSLGIVVIAFIAAIGLLHLILNDDIWG
jgi:hypothetical protein